MASSNLNFNTLRQQYRSNAEQQYQNKVDNLGKQRDTDLQKSNQAYAQNANNAYVAYRKADQGRTAQASSMGMTGGAREQLAVGDATAYNRSVANLNSGRLQASQNVRDAYNQNVMNAYNDYQNNVANNDLSLGQAEINYNYQKAIDDRNFNYQKAVDAQNRADQQAQYRQEHQDAENQARLNVFANTVSRYNTQASANAAIKNLNAQISAAQKAGRPTYLYTQMKYIVEAQLAALRQAGVR